MKALTTFFQDFSDTSHFTELDIIFIAGDQYHSLMDCSGDDVHESLIFLARLMRFCSRHQIKLRVLEGTPSHDWKQMEFANTLDKIMQIDLDLRYITTLHIERMEDLKLDILYVPDEWSPNTEDTLQQVNDLMLDMGLTQVDIGIMHGFFGYQLPNIPTSDHRHSEAAYLSLVKHFISIGHVHTFSHYERIIAQGSFDRLCHGEEEPKGAVVCEIRGPQGDRFTFLENKLAKIFRTVELRYNDLEKSLRTIANQTKNDPPGSHIRIKAKKDHPVYLAFEEVKRKFPFFHLSKTSIEDKDSSKESRSLRERREFTPIAITEDNVVNLVIEEADQNHELDPSTKDALTSLLLSIEI